MEITFYIRLWVYIEIYRIFFRKIVYQFEKEIKFRLAQPKKLEIQDGVNLRSSKYYDEKFLKKLRKLRVLYLKTVTSFGKFCQKIGFTLTRVTLLGYISLIIIIGVVVISLKEKTEFELVHFSKLIKFLSLSCFMYLKIYSFDRIETCVSILYSFVYLTFQL